MTEARQSAGTVASQSLVAEGRQGRAPDGQSAGPWPRVLDLRQAARYCSLSYWSLRDLVAAGIVPAVRVPSVRVDRGQRKSGSKSRRYELVKGATGRAVRKLLVDRVDLDRLIAEWKADS